jgi:hypothetical protein
MSTQLASHRDGDPLRFEVAVGGDHTGEPITAFITQTSWRARYGAPSGDSNDADLLQTYLANRQLIDGAVLRRVAAGGRSPVVLRAADL